MTEFAWSPVTLEREGVVYPVIVGINAVYDPESDIGAAKGLAWIVLKWDGRDVGVAEVINQSDQEFRFLMSNGLMAVIRPAVPADAGESEQFRQPYDLPIEVIGAIVNSVFDSSQAVLSAAYDDQGDVHTLILETPIGLYARYSKQWIKITDTAAIDTLAVTYVPDDDLNAYDEADIAGRMLNITALNPEARPVTEVIEPPPAPVTASAPTRAVVIASADDLPAAISYASSDEGKGSRWYVARRWKALGGEATGITLPWET